MLLFLAACSGDGACPPNAIEKDGECVPVEVADTDTDTDADTDTDTDTDTDACTVLELTTAPLGGPVNNASVLVTLDVAAEVELVCTLTAGPPTSVELLPPDAVWSYADGPTVDPDWADPAYDASGWSTGPAPLGYGEGVTTEIGYGGDPDAKYITSWFRTDFTVADPTEITNSAVTVTYDDSAVVYLNGVEVDRWNLPGGALTADTPADESVELTTARAEIDPALLVAGENVLAIEVHQSSGSSSDVWMEATVTSDGPSEGDPDERFVLTSAASTSHQIALRGLLADSRYACIATPTCGTAAEVDLVTAPLPDVIPQFTYAGAPPSPGYVLLNAQQPCIEVWAMYLLIVDPEGRVRWYDQADGIDAAFSTDVESILLDDQTILWAGGDDPDAVPQRVDLDGETVWRSSYPGVDADQYHHDVVWTQDETIAGIVHEDLVARNGATVAGFTIVEQDPVTNTELWRWNAQSAYDAGTLRTTGGPSTDPWHANALAEVVDADGPAFYVNLFYAGHIVRIDRTTGDLTWTLGRGGDFTLVDAAGVPADESGWFLGAHAVHVIDATHVSAYDNGDSSTGSRYLVYELDAAALTATVTAEWSDGWYNATWGDGDDLGDGTVLVNQSASSCTGGQDGLGSVLIADLASGAVPWRITFTDANDSSYRSQWIGACTLFGNEKYCP